MSVRKLLVLVACLSPLWASAESMSLSDGAVMSDAPAKGKTIGKLNGGIRVNHIQSQGDQALVQVEGWVHRSAFEKIPPLLARNRSLTLSQANADIRSAADGGRAMGRLGKDAKPEMRDIKGKWIKVTVGAWVPAALLAEVSAAAPSSDKPASASAPEGAGPGPRVRLSTSMGNILIELDPARAPKSAANFLSYVGKGHYDGTIFHRVIDNFMVQGGGYATDYSKKPTDAPVPIESSNGLKNARGTVAMARTNDPNSATSQFYINVVDNEFLNYVSDAEPGYTVFGRVIEGMDVVDQIRKVPTGPGPAELSSDVPKTMVVITKASKVD